MNIKGILQIGLFVSPYFDVFFYIVSITFLIDVSLLLLLSEVNFNCLMHFCRVANVSLSR
jgi:hypothetical protein